MAITAHQISKNYGLKPILKEVAFSVNPGERVGFIGPNGSGKTTLLRTIAGQIEPMAGQFHIGSSVQMDYMSQEQENLEPDSTPLDTIQAVVHNRYFMERFATEIWWVRDGRLQTQLW